MKRRDFLKGTAALGAASMAFPGMSFAQAPAGLPAYYPADYGAIVEAAKKEGTVVAYGSASQLDPAKAYFNSLFPEIEVQFVSLGAAEVIERYLTEAGSNNPTCDILWTTATDSMMRMVERGEIVNYQSAERSQYPDWASPSPGVYWFLIEPQVMIWNKVLLPDALVPKGLEDLAAKVQANPDVFNGRMVTFGAHFGSNGYVAAHRTLKHHGEKGWDWLKVIGPQSKLERSSGPMVEKTLLGEYVLGYFAGFNGPVAAARDPDRGKVLGWKLIEDGQVFFPFSMAIPRASKNQNAAKLLLDAMMLSHGGQVGWMKASRAPTRPDITDEERGDLLTYPFLAKGIGESNALIRGYDPAIVSDYDAFIARWKSVYGVS